MTTEALTRTAPSVGDQCVTLRGIGWRGYSTVLRLRGERPRPRMVYLDGDLLLMSPALPHERRSFRLGQFVVEVVVGLDIPCVPSGQTTFRRREKRAGVEGDQSFYLANEARVRGKDGIDLEVDPPPDLAIESVHTHGASKAVRAYQRLGVPEVWVGGEKGLRILVRQPDGRYEASETSAAFPFLSAAEIFDWVQRPQVTSDTDWIKALRAWVRDTLAPRARNRGG